MLNPIKNSLSCDFFFFSNNKWCRCCFTTSFCHDFFFFSSSFFLLVKTLWLSKTIPLRKGNHATTDPAARAKHSETMEPERGSAQSSHSGSNTGDSPPPPNASGAIESTDGDPKESVNESLLSGLLNAPSKPSPSSVATKKPSRGKKNSAKHSTTGPSYREVRVLNPGPYFYYIDHSRDEDDNPLVPLSPAMSVPNFVIKLHAILICESLSDVIAWMPHGRSWQIANQVRRVLLF